MAGLTKMASDEIKKRVADSKKKKNEAEAKITPKKGSIATKTTVSATDIKQAKTANQLNTMQRRIDDMPDGNIKTAYKKMLKAQRDRFEKMQAGEKDTIIRKQQQSVADRKAKPVSLPPSLEEVTKKNKQKKTLTERRKEFDEARKIARDKKNNPETFEEAKKLINSKRMNDAQRQSALIKAAVKFDRTITINGKTFGPKKAKANSNNRGGLQRGGHMDMRKGGMFYK